jgi:hypothetical protein
MVEETPSRMTVGYRILSDENLSPVHVLRDENDITIDDDYSRKISFHNPSLYTAEHDSSYFDLNLSLEPTILNGLNYLNVASYLAHLFVSYGIGVWGLGGILPTRWEISQEYETLITPARWAYYLWTPILVFQAFFALAQLLRDFRARPIVQDGTGYFFFYTCLIQTAWTLFFSFRLFIPSFICVVAAFVSLASLLVSQHCSQVRGQHSWVEYWLFRFPFFLHCGWMAVMVVVHFSLLCRHETSSIGTQIAADMIAIAVLLPVATFLLWSGEHLAIDFCIPSVIIWSYVSYESRVGVLALCLFFLVVVLLLLTPRIVTCPTDWYCNQTASPERCISKGLWR